MTLHGMSDFSGTSPFSTDFSINIEKSYFMKIHAVGAELFHADRWTDGQT